MRTALLLLVLLLPIIWSAKPNENPRKEVISKLMALWTSIKTVGEQQDSRKFLYGIISLENQLDQKLIYQKLIDHRLFAVTMYGMALVVHYYLKTNKNATEAIFQKAYKAIYLFIEYRIQHNSTDTEDLIKLLHLFIGEIKKTMAIVREMKEKEQLNGFFCNEFWERCFTTMDMLFGVLQYTKRGIKELKKAIETKLVNFDESGKKMLNVTMGIIILIQPHLPQYDYYADL